MSIAAITSPHPSQVGVLRAATAGAEAAGGVDPGDGPATGSASVSPAGKLFAQLARLQQSDPTKFKAVVADIAKRLQAAAQRYGGAEGKALANLATKFQQAAQTGDLSPLRPGPRHHHRHHHGTVAYQQAAGAAPTADARAQALDVIGRAIATDLVTTGA